MSCRQYTSIIGIAVAVLFAFVLGGTARSLAQEPERDYSMGSPDAFLAKYRAFRTEQIRGGTPDLLRVPLGYVKGLSRSFTSIAGVFSLDLDRGAYRVSLSSLTPREAYSVWLVDAGDDTTLPSPDVVYRLAAFVASGACRWP
jgi:hypothetical protein